MDKVDRQPIRYLLAVRLSRQNQGERSNRHLTERLKEALSVILVTVVYT